MDTATRTRPGWYYVGNGELRFHDDEGWTDNVLLSEDIRGMDWPPPDPTAGKPEAESVAGRPAPAPSRLTLMRLLRREDRRQVGRHRAPARDTTRHAR